MNFSRTCDYDAAVGRTLDRFPRDVMNGSTPVGRMIVCSRDGVHQQLSRGQHVVFTVWVRRRVDIERRILHPRSDGNVALNESRNFAF